MRNNGAHRYFIYIIIIMCVRFIAVYYYNVVGICGV